MVSRLQGTTIRTIGLAAILTSRCQPTTVRKDNDLDSIEHPLHTSYMCFTAQTRGRNHRLPRFFLRKSLYYECLCLAIRAKNRMYCCIVRPLGRLMTNGPSR